MKSSSINRLFAWVVFIVATDTLLETKISSIIALKLLKLGRVRQRKKNVRNYKKLDIQRQK